MSFKAKINTAWKLKDESVQDYNRFLNFRDRVPRISYEEYSHEIGLSLSRLYLLSSKYRWAERIQEYDASLEQALQEQNRAVAASVRLNRIKTYKLLQEKILARLESLDASTLTAGQVSMFLKNLDLTETRLLPDSKDAGTGSDDLLRVLADSLKGGQK